MIFCQDGRKEHYTSDWELLVPTYKDSATYPNLVQMTMGFQSGPQAVEADSLVRADRITFDFR